MPDINRAYTWAIQTCNAPNVRYSYDLRNQITVNGLTYYDCSSFIWYALKAGGWPLGDGWPFTTNIMLPILQAQGFRSVPITGKWLAGDIVHRSAGQLAAFNNGHTEMVYRSGETNGTGITMGAHADWFYLDDGSIYYVPDADQVSIINYVASYDRYTTLWRYGSGADEDEGADFTGSTQYVVAAICAVWSFLTSLNPKYYDDNNYVFVGSSSGGMFCLGDRRWSDYTTYCLQQQKTVMSGDTQMDYFIDEDYWNADLSSYSSLSDFLNSTDTDFANLITEFLAGWYDITVSTIAMDIIISYARQIKDFISENANDTSINFWYSADGESLSASERLHNSVMVYKALSAGGGGGGNPDVPVKHKFKGYKYIRYHNIRK